MIRAALGRQAMDGMLSRSIISNSSRHHRSLIRSSLGSIIVNHNINATSSSRFLSIKALESLNNSHNNSNNHHQRTRCDISPYSSSSSSLQSPPYPLSSMSLHLCSHNNTPPPHHLSHPLTTTKRNYIFLPALSDISKSILSTLPPWLTTNPNSPTTTTTTQNKIKLVIKLRQTRQYLIDSAHHFRRQKTTHRFRQWRDDLRRRTTAKYRRLSSVGRRLMIAPETWFDTVRSDGRRRWRSWAREGRRMREAGSWRRRRWRTTTTRTDDNRSTTTTGRGPAMGSSSWGDDETEMVVVVIDEPAERAWFDEEGYPLASRDVTTGRFVNPWNSESSNGVHDWRDVMKWKWQRWQNGRRRRSAAAADETLPSSLERDDDVRTTTAATNDPSPSSNDDEVNLTWIGHSTCLVKMNSFTLLTDPIFSSYVGPLPTTRLLGVDREIPPAPSLFDILSSSSSGAAAAAATSFLDVVLISHDHYDHLDVDSVRALNDSGRVRYWCVPLGIKDWLMEVGGVNEEDIVEMEWWDEAVFERRRRMEQLKQQPTDNDDDDTAVRDDGGERRESLRFVGLRQRRQNGDERQEGRGREEFDDCDSVTTRTGDNDCDVIVNDGDSTLSSSSSSSTMTVTCAPSHHWCCRTPFDRNSRLWCSYAVKTTTTTTTTQQPQQYPHSTSFDDITPTTTNTNNNPNNNTTNNNNERKTLNFYFAGDTALPPTFPLHRQIGHRLGPFDLAAIPIGAYAPSWFMRDSHCDPGESVTIHKELKSRRSVAIHWGTFPMAEEPFFEPPKLLKDETMKAGLNEGEFVAIRHGDTISSSSSSSSATDMSSSSLNDEEEDDDGRHHHHHGDINAAMRDERYYNTNDDNGLQEERQDRCYG